MEVDWKDVRYRGDQADVEELFETCRVDAPCSSAAMSLLEHRGQAWKIMPGVAK